MNEYVCSLAAISSEQPVALLPASQVSSCLCVRVLKTHHPIQFYRTKETWHKPMGQAHGVNPLAQPRYISRAQTEGSCHVRREILLTQIDRVPEAWAGFSIGTTQTENRNNAFISQRGCNFNRVCSQACVLVFRSPRALSPSFGRSPTR
jgi:hypothetical protein